MPRLGSRMDDYTFQPNSTVLLVVLSIVLSVALPFYATLLSIEIVTFSEVVTVDYQPMFKSLVYVLVTEWVLFEANPL
jgi:hypothetical protein